MKTLRPLTMLTMLVVGSPLCAESAPVVEPTGPLTLRDARALAIERSPELRAVGREVRAKHALSSQAGRLPNPELRGEIENVGGSGAREGFEDTESTLRLLEVIELGGKRAARRRVAELGRELSTWDYEAKRLALTAGVTKAFVTTLAAQERRALATERERLAAEILSAMERSVGAGASVPVDAMRARVALGRARIERATAERELEVARALLASTWGSDTPRFSQVVGDLAMLVPLPSEARLLPSLQRNPDVARWATERAERRAALALERANRVPDVTVGAGARHFSDNGDNALVFELSLPLPIFDRNRGGIAAAHERLAKTRDEAEASAVSARAALAEAYQRLAAAHAQASTLRTDLLPEARQSVRGTAEAFRKGLLRPLDVFEAQRTLVDLEGEYLRALESVHLAAADLERLTTVPLEDLGNGGVR